MEIKKMIELTDKLLQTQQGKPGLPSYTGDIKRLIDEIADLAENTLVWEWNRADANGTDVAALQEEIHQHRFAYVQDRRHRRHDPSDPLPVGIQVRDWGGAAL